MATANAPAGRLTRKGLATRARIVEAAAGLMFRRGVAGTSTEDVRAAAQVSNSQLYHYFADKNALVRAVIEYQADEIIDGQRPLLDELDSLAAFRQWRDMLVDLQRQRHCEGGCPLGSLSSELAETDESARTALAASFDRWESPIRDGLRLGEGTLVGMGACIGRDTEPWSVYQGNPARKRDVASTDVEL